MLCISPGDVNLISRQTIGLQVLGGLHSSIERWRLLADSRVEALALFRPASTTVNALLHAAATRPATPAVKLDTTDSCLCLLLHAA
jgi:hypothetical protein